MDEEDEERKMKLKVIVVKFLFLNGENGWMEGGENSYLRQQVE